MTRPNESAFPLMPSHTDPTKVPAEFTGLSKREYLATKLLAAFIASGDHQNPFTIVGGGHVAASIESAVILADRLLAELERTKS